MFLGIPDNIWVALALIWSLPWKGVALWKSARNRQTAWFVAALLVNTLGILEIVYISFFQRDKN
jgi:methionyl-tRNA synthetase